VNTTIVLDTNALIRLFKGVAPEVERALMGCSRLFFPLAVYAEFLAGLAQRKRPPEQTLFEELLATPNTFVHRPTEATAQHYARILNQLRKQGTPIPTNDIWIAAETMELGGALYTYDSHFEQIPLLNCVIGED